MKTGRCPKCGPSLFFESGVEACIWRAPCSATWRRGMATAGLVRGVIDLVIGLIWMPWVASHAGS